MRKALLLLLLLASTSVQAQRLTPLLRLQGTSLQVPFVERALRDPLIEPRSYGSLKAKIAEDEKLLATLSGANSKDRAMVLTKSRNLYESYLAAAYFELDRGTGSARRRANRYRRRAMEYALQHAQRNREKASRVRAQYNAFVVQYLLNIRAKNDVIRNLEKISPSLPRPLRAGADILMGKHHIEFGDVDKGVVVLSRSLMRQDRIGAVVARLILAKHFAGVNRLGNAKRRPNLKEYRNNLAEATQRIVRLDRSDYPAIFAYSLSLWRKVEPRSSWYKPPFVIKNFRTDKNYAPLLEQQALESYARKEYDRAIAVYTSVGNILSADAATPVHQRIVDIHQTKYRRSGRHQDFEKALAGMYSFYLNKGASVSKVVGNRRNSLYRRYKAFVDSLLMRAKKQTATKAFRKLAVAVGMRFKRYVLTTPQKVKLNSDMAEILKLEGAHKGAVALYVENMGLTRTTPAFRVNALNAIRSQRVLANWPARPPWNQPQERVLKAERRTLLGLYMELNQYYGKKTDWQGVAHIGQLHLALGELPKAFAFWERNIKISLDKFHAPRAIGLMITTYHRGKVWPKVEELARFSMARKLTPILNEKPINTMALFADSLYFGGKVAFEQKKYDVAVAKWDEFIRVFRRDPRREEALYLLAFALRGATRYVDSVTTFKQLVDEYPRSGYLDSVYSLGGEWSIEIALEEFAIFFLQRYVTTFPRGKSIKVVRESLVNLYLGRGLYGEAARIFRQQIADSSLPKGTQVMLSLKYMDVHERYGDLELAKWGADRALSLTNNAAIKAQCYGFLARYAAKKGQKVNWQQFEKLLAGLNQRDPFVRENRAQIQFRIAEGAAGITKQEVFNLGLKNPRAALNKHYSNFLGIQKLYERVCGLGEVSMCAPALLRLARVTNNTIETIQDIKVPSTLDAKTVDAFSARKRDIINYLVRTALRSDSRALQVIKLGNTVPVWTHQVIWQNTNDWNFDQVVGEKGTGYVQWPAFGRSKGG